MAASGGDDVYLMFMQQSNYDELYVTSLCDFGTYPNFEFGEVDCLECPDGFYTASI